MSSKFLVTFKCGHVDEIEIDGCPAKMRESRAKWRASQTLCPTCQAAEEAEDDLKFHLDALRAGKENHENGLPELVGSEKQIEWAEVVRNRLMLSVELSYESELERLDHRILKGFVKDPDFERDCLEAAADFWISRLSTPDAGRIISMKDWHVDLHRKAFEYKRDGLPCTTEYVVGDPSEVHHRYPARVSVSNDTVKASYPTRNEDFGAICKKHDLIWDGSCWCTSSFCGSPSAFDSAACLGNHLLKRGFAVEFSDEIIKEMAVNGTFHPDAARWIGETNQDYVIRYEPNSDIDKFLKLIAGDRIYHKPGYTKAYVKKKHILGVIDLAELYGFFWKGRGVTVETVDVSDEIAEFHHIPQKSAKDILDSSREVLDDLKD